MLGGATPEMRFVRCPKCLKVLAEVPGIPIYKCGGCGTILRAKAHSGGGESVGLASVASGSRNVSQECSLPNGEEASAGAQAVGCGSGGRGNAEEEEEEEKDPALLQRQEHEEERSSDLPRLSDKLEASPEIVEDESSSSSEDDDTRSGRHGLRTTSSLAYEGSLSSTDEERTRRISQKYLLLSRRTLRGRTSGNSVESITGGGEEGGMRRRTAGSAADRKQSWKYSNGGKLGLVGAGDGNEAKEQETSFASEDFVSVPNRMESEKEASLVSQTKDDHAMILKKVDELKDDLHGFFNKAAAHGEGRVRLKENRSSLLPFPKEPIPSSCFHCSPGGRSCCHNEHCRPCPHNVCCHSFESPAPAPAAAEPENQNPQPNDKKPPKAAKHHCRPVSGGAPFVICYRCYRLLQLPSDFLLTVKLIQRLRCGGCSEVLKYSFRPRTRSAPRSPAEVRHPPSEDEVESKGGFDDEGYGVSYSSEYETSCVKSTSYEAETSLHQRKMAKEEEEDDKWRLHRLMGYPSARHLLFETIKADGGRRTDAGR